MSAIFPGRSNQYSFDMNEAKDVIRKPSVVAASEGKYGPRWIVDRETPWYEELCREFSYYMAKVLSGASRNEESRQYSAQEWYNCAVSKKAFLFSYVKNVDMELFTWLFGIQGQGGGTGFTGIFKAALLYEESPNDNEMVVCITDGVIIQKHIIRTGNLDRKELSEIIGSLSGNMRSRTYGAIGDYFSGTATSPDILYIYSFSMIKDSMAGFYDLQCRVPQEVIAADPYDVADRNAVAMAMLGNESYESDAGGDGSIVFVNLNNIYRINEDGMLQYRYKPSGGSLPKGNAGEAFAEALGFIYKYGRIRLTGDADIVLTGMEETDGSYEFYFDYYYKEHPIITDYSTTAGGGGTGTVTSYGHAITIEAAGGRVISADWLIRRFSRDNEILRNYDFIRAHEMMVNVFRNDGMLDVVGGEDFSVSGAGIGYRITEGMKKTQLLVPVWIFRTNVEGYRQIVLEMQ
ncbi:MAG: hypothetical protein PHG48_03050 [Eubacteriales bacterium]|nr:hypothetical protein [Eubacteriales bacterium]